METKFVTITEDQFYEKFNMVTNHIDDNASFDGCMFETYGEELEYIQNFAKENPKKIWTILDCDGKMYYSSGYHYVNRLGYFITEEAVEDGCEIEVKLEGFGDCQCGSCEQTFDEVDLDDGSCPHCGSGNWVRGCIDEPEPPVQE